MFSNGADERSMDINITIDGVRPATCRAVIECMYTGVIGLSENNVREILVAANHIKFAAVQQVCGAFLMERLDQDNCLRMLSLGQAYHLTELTSASMKIAAKGFPIISKSYDYIHLDYNLLIGLLGSDELKVKNELEVFAIAVEWIEADRARRIQYAGDILSQVRLPLLTPSEIVDHVETTKFLMDIPSCQALVKEALHYHVLPPRQSLLQVLYNPHLKVTACIGVIHGRSYSCTCTHTSENPFTSKNLPHYNCN